MFKRNFSVFLVFVLLGLGILSQTIIGKDPHDPRKDLFGERYGNHFIDEFDGGMSLLLNLLEAEDLSSEEIADLLYMRESEKLGRDVYTTLYLLHPKEVFATVMGSEQRHMDAVKCVLDKYKIQDPIKDDTVGVFPSQEFTYQYIDLTAAGTLIDAYTSAVFFEELDLFKLLIFISQTDNEDIQILYQNLMKGSRNHLRVFMKHLIKAGGTYVPTYLTQEQIEDILSKPMERGHLDAQGEQIFGNIGW